tara:strand:- start:462 stop:1133 length:672 start_codon:yes stop_codon:yes gene_type:complete
MDKNLGKYRFNSTKIIISKNIVSYPEAMKFMEAKVNKIIKKEELDTIWLLNHPSIYTYGTTSKKSDFLKKNSLPLYKTNRGGQITYHGPGQRIAYYMINLNNKKKDIRYFVKILENILIDTLSELNIQSRSYNDRIGIWVTKVNNINLKKEKKIGSIGLRIKKWVTYHGVSINIDNDLSFFKNINPCGIKDYSVTSLKDLGIIIKQNQFDNLLLKYSKKYLEI